MRVIPALMVWSPTGANTGVSLASVTVMANIFFNEQAALIRAANPDAVAFLGLIVEGCRRLERAAADAEGRVVITAGPLTRL